MICSMTDTEMKLMVSCLEFKLQDKIDNDLDSVKDLQTLIKKINIMIERQTPYVWYNWRYRVLVVYVGNSINFNCMEYKMTRETKDGIGFVITAILLGASIILIHFGIN